MKKSLHVYVLVVAVLVLAVHVACAQVATGVYPHGSFDNLGNL